MQVVDVTCAVAGWAARLLLLWPRQTGLNRGLGERQAPGHGEPRCGFEIAAWRKPQTVRARLSSPAFAFITMPWK
jgi:hypothetical protein